MPGATHDAFVISNTNISVVMEIMNGWLLDDSGYSLQRGLVTPLLQTASQKEINYNKATARRQIPLFSYQFRILCMHLSPPVPW